MSYLSNKAIEIAITQLGKEEQPRGSNWGSDVKAYLNSVGINFPASWCAAFVYWCFREASGYLSTPPPLIRTGGVLNHWSSAKKQYKFTTPEVGDIFIMDLGHGLGHTGIVIEVSADRKSVLTIEGNTNDTGSREGYEVCKRSRPTSSIKGYLRY